uniref:APC membrane recruitment protein 1 n=1 Tax=Sphaeramia orbicularis TaxID=375764 RepID=A0A672ZF82_9TELE
GQTHIDITLDTKDEASVSGQPSLCDEITEELHSDAMNATVKSQKSGRFRRTALTFFGVRRSKNLWSSKKGIGKSKTHDGLSKACHDDNLRSGYASKSLTLTRHKRGLRSLFHSIKHHRNQRNVGLDKTEMIAMSCPPCKKEVPVVQDNIKQYFTECLGPEPDVPDFEKVICDISIGAECIDADAMALEKNAVMQDSPKSELGDELCDNQMEEMNLMAVVASEYEEERSRVHSDPCLKLKMTSEPGLKSEMPAGSSEQLNLIFGDVASLKSFDSLTGCGDIIADQEDDSITESTVSGERSRNGGKRASCYLTYQGGGEEMASPEDFDEECLQDFWGNDASEDICCACNQDHTDVTTELTSSHNMDLLNSNSVQQASGMDTSSIADVLTPQSEHQESVPNSDEGYYDSTTPGPEEGQEKTDRLRPDRLPRDSYSGDALYELFAPDESLISPHYENKSKLPGSKQCEYLSTPVDVTDSAFVPEMNRLQISPELYKGHSFLEIQSTYFEHSASPKNSILRKITYFNNDEEDGQAVCFSQALVDYTKHSQMLSNLHNSVEGLEANSAFTPNMEALPTIVTFDVVDMHNEGEYDEQIQMDLEEDISSPYQEFEESYLQKDAFAECDYQMLDLYEQNLFSNTWAIASLPRHLGLTRVSQSMSNPLSLDRRSRSLDTESLEVKMPDTYRENRGAIISCFQTEKDSEQESSSYYKKNALVSPLEARDSSSIMAWQTRSEMALSLPLTDREITDKVQSLSQTQIKHKIFSAPSSSDFSNSKALHLCSNLSDNVSCELISPSPELYNRQCHLPLQAESCLPHSTFFYSEMIGEEALSNDTDKDVFCKAATNLQSYNQCVQSRAAAREGMSPPESPLNTGLSTDDTDVSETGMPREVMSPAACTSLPEGALN